MLITFDGPKNVINKRKHKISLADAEHFDFDAAIYAVDDREDYGEVRYRALRFLDARLYSLVFVLDGENIRAISLRKATKYEEKEFKAGR